ncbi:MAG: CinA family protein [Candidatus Enteromonas sp.]
MSNTYDILSFFAKKGLTIGAVESLTAGLFSSLLCEVPGASAVFKGALVTYSPELKEVLANVKASTIQSEGVVSAEVAKQMAIGGKATLGVDVCVSCTGNAGPSVEEGEAPLGRVYLGLAYKDAVWTIPMDYQGTRNEIRKKTVGAMLAFIESLIPMIQNS